MRILALGIAVGGTADPTTRGLGIAATADLQIQIAAAPSPVEAGRNLTYTIQLTNAGPQTAKTISVADTLPSWTSLVSCAATNGGVCRGSGRARRVTFSSLPTGATAGITLVVAVSGSTPNGMLLVNRAHVKASSTDPIPGNNSTSITVRVDQLSADLGLAMVGGPDPAVSGGEVAYDLTLSNAGPTAASEVTVTAPLPPSAALVSCTASGGGTCAGPPTAPTISFASLAAAGSATIRLTASVDPAAPDSSRLEASASVAASTPDPSLADNAAAVSLTVVQAADLGLAQSAAPDPVLAGGEVTFTLGVTNAGPAMAAATIQDELPASTTFGWCAATGAGVCGGTGNSRSIDYAALPPGASETITLVATVDAATADRTSLVNTARVASSSRPDLEPADDLATAVVTVLNPAPELRLGVTAAPDPVPVDSTITYTLTLENVGGVPAANVVLEDTLPPLTTFVACTASGSGACGSAGNIASVTYAGVAPTASETVVLTTRVNADVPGGTTITNRASLRSDTPEPNLSNNSASVSVSVVRPLQRPDIVLILTDDQPWHEATPEIMPITNSLIGDMGVRFDRAYASTPLCCPSRATVLNGLYSHNSGVLDNNDIAKLNADSTVAVWLQQVGYHTAYIGKYLNQYDSPHPLTYPAVPPGWDRWYVFKTADYYGFWVSEDGTPVFIDSTGSSEEYSTNVLAHEAVDFIEATPPDQPFFLLVAPFAPHKPSDPDYLDATLFPSASWRPPNFNEEDISDKPSWIQNDIPLDPALMDMIYRKQLQSLQAVDRAIETIVDALARTGRLANTVLVFTSDNAYSLGEHRWETKICEWESCTRVPLMIRAPGVLPRTEGRVVSNVDFVPTFLELSGAAPHAVDGRSLVGLLDDPLGSLEWSDEALLEFRSYGFSVRYQAIVTSDWKYVSLDNGEEELYDLVADPWELESLHASPIYLDQKEYLRSRLELLKQK